MIINEVRRATIISKSKIGNLGRYSSRTQVRDVSIDRVGLLEIAYLDQPNLDIHFKVSDHSVTVSLHKFMDYLRSEYRKNYKKIRDEGGVSVSAGFRRIVEAALDKSLDIGNISLSCDCADFRYRYAYVATTNGYKYGDPESRPANKTNPNGEGSACKHVIKVLSSPSQWKRYVITGVVNAIKKDPRILDKE